MEACLVMLNILTRTIFAVEKMIVNTLQLTAVVIRKLRILLVLF